MLEARHSKLIRALALFAAVAMGTAITASVQGTAPSPTTSPSRVGTATTAPSPLSALPGTWQTLKPAGLAELYQSLATMSQFKPEAIESARRQLGEFAWSAYLRSPALLESDDKLVRCDWLLLAAEVAPSLSGTQRAAVARALSDHYLLPPGSTSNLSGREITTLARALDASGALDASPGLTDKLTTVVRSWALSGVSELGTIDELTMEAHLLVLDNSADSRQAVARLVEAGVNGFLPGAGKNLGNLKLQSLLVEGSTNLPPELRRRLSQQIAGAFVDSGPLGKLSPAAVTELHYCLLLLGYSWQQGLDVSARWVLSRGTESTAASVLRVLVAPGAPMGAMLTDDDPATTKVVEAIRKSAEQISAEGSMATAEERSSIGVLLSQWLLVLPPDQRQKLERSPVITLLTLADLGQVHSILARGPTAMEAGDVLQTWAAAPGSMTGAAADVFRGDSREHLAALGTLKALAPFFNDQQRQSLGSSIIKQSLADPKALGACELPEISNLQSVLSSFGDRSAAPLVVWLGFDRPWTIATLRWQTDSFNSEHADPSARADEETKDQLAQWLPAASAGLEAMHGPIREDGAKFLTYVFLRAGATDQWIKILNQKLQDPAIVGDSKAQWLLARGYFAEALIDSDSNPKLKRPFSGTVAVPWIQQAQRAARSPDMKLRCVGVMASRYSMAGEFDVAKSLLDKSAKQFSDAASSRQLKEWSVDLSQAQTIADRISLRKQLQGQLTSFREQITDAKSRHKPDDYVRSLEKIAAATETKLRSLGP